MKRKLVFCCKRNESACTVIYVSVLHIVSYITKYEACHRISLLVLYCTYCIRIYSCLALPVFLHHLISRRERPNSHYFLFSSSLISMSNVKLPLLIILINYFSQIDVLFFAAKVVDFFFKFLVVFRCHF